MLNPPRLTILQSLTNKTTSSSAAPATTATPPMKTTTIKTTTTSSTSTPAKNTTAKTTTTPTVPTVNTATTKTTTPPMKTTTAKTTTSTVPTVKTATKTTTTSSFAAPMKTTTAKTTTTSAVPTVKTTTKTTTTSAVPTVKTSPKNRKRAAEDGPAEDGQHPNKKQRMPPPSFYWARMKRLRGLNTFVVGPNGPNDRPSFYGKMFELLDKAYQQATEGNIADKKTITDQAQQCNGLRMVLNGNPDPDFKKLVETKLKEAENRLRLVKTRVDETGAKVEQLKSSHKKVREDLAALIKAAQDLLDENQELGTLQRLMSILSDSDDGDDSNTEDDEMTLRPEAQTAASSSMHDDGSDTEDDEMTLRPEAQPTATSSSSPNGITVKHISPSKTNVTVDGIVTTIEKVKGKGKNCFGLTYMPTTFVVTPYRVSGRGNDKKIARSCYVFPAPSIVSPHIYIGGNIQINAIIALWNCTGRCFNITRFDDNGRSCNQNALFKQYTTVTMNTTSVFTKIAIRANRHQSAASCQKECPRRANGSGLIALLLVTKDHRVGITNLRPLV